MIRIAQVLFFIFLALAFLLFYHIAKKRSTQAEKIGLKLIRFFIFCLPQRIEDGKKIGRLVGKIFYFLRISRKKNLINLYIAFAKEKTEVEIQQILKEHYMFFIGHFFELCYYYQMPTDEIRKRFKVDQAKIEEIKNRNQTTGVQILCMHYCQVNLLITLVGLYFDNLLNHVTEQKNKLFDEFLSEIRKKCGTKLILKSPYSTLTLIKALKNKQNIGLAPDLNNTQPEMFYPFFGTEASVVPLVYFFVSKTKCPVYLFSLEPEEGDSYKLNIKELKYQNQGTPEEISKSLTKVYFSEMEAFIRKYPEQYMWLNYRWLTRPEGDSRNFYKMKPEEVKAEILARKREEF